MRSTLKPEDPFYFSFYVHMSFIDDLFKEVPLNAQIMRNTFQFKQKNMTNVACLHGQHFYCLEGI